MGITWDLEGRRDDARNSVKVGVIKTSDLRGPVKAVVMMLKEFQHKHLDQNLFIDVSDDNILIYREENDEEFSDRRRLESEIEAIAEQVRNAERRRESEKEAKKEYDLYLVLKSKFEGEARPNERVVVDHRHSRRSSVCCGHAYCIRGRPRPNKATGYLRPISIQLRVCDAC